MKVLVYPHDLNMGGSQTNAIELAAGVRDLGVEAMIFGRPGVLVDRIDELGLEFIESPDPGRRPSISIARLLRGLARERRIDVLHGYEWPPTLECVAASGSLSGRRRSGPVTVSTVMSMSVPPFIPTTTPLVVGTEQIAATELAGHRDRVHVIEPPVDLGFNVAPTRFELARFRARWKLNSTRPLLVCVTRLAYELKAEGILTAIDAVRGPLRDRRPQLLIVGDGPARGEVQRAATAANLERADTVVLTGELRDPRVAYAVADVVIGMGSSALRALAFGKPLVVQGEGGFFERLTPDSWPVFRWQGWYGVGASPADGPGRLTEAVTPLLDRVGLRAELGAFGLQLVRERFSLATAAKRQLQIYEAAMAHRPSTLASAPSLARAGGLFTSYYVSRKVARLTGRRAADDFNATPVAATGSPRPLPDGAIPAAGALVYLAGAPWHAVAGTDRHLATAVAHHRPVIWVDPPVSIVSRIRRRLDVPAVSGVAPGITRIHPIAPPGVTRPVLRVLSRWWAHLLLNRYLRQTGLPVAAVVVSSPEPLLVHWRNSPAHRVYFATDDFVAGSGLLGLSASYLSAARDRNLAVADSVLAVTANLAEVLTRRRGSPTRVFANGCNLKLYAGLADVTDSVDINLPRPIAGVVGQLNERLDLDLLEAVADHQISLLLVGPRYEQDPAFRQRLTRLIDRSNVQWVDRRPVEELPAYMSAVEVGLTPYADTPFNRASFPLKTLEYLAAARPVVATPLSANAGLDPAVVRLASTPEAFGQAVVDTLLTPTSEATRERCRAQAALFSWSRRADELEELISAASWRS